MSPWLRISSVLGRECVESPPQNMHAGEHTTMPPPDGL